MEIDLLTASANGMVADPCNPLLVDKGESTDISLSIEAVD
jgi:hypothetical protein